MVLGWPVGGLHDPEGRTGLAQAMAAFLQLCQRDLEAQARFAVQASDRFTLLWATVPAEDLQARLDFLARLLAGRIPLTDDLFALALARARLRADDKTHRYPGPALHNKARQCLYSGDARGRQVDGVPAEIAGITREELRTRYQERYGSRGAVLATVGGFAAAELEARLRRHLAAPTGADPPALRPAVPAPAGEGVVRSEIHPRVDGPYVTVAFPAPEPSKPSAAYLVAAGALRHQAQAWFGQQRGRESFAGFPFVRYEWREADPLLMINRRGPDGGRAEDVRREISGFLASVRSHGLDEQYLRMAKSEIINTLERPSQGGPREVVLRARVLCLRKLLGLDDAFLAQVREVPFDEARTELLRYLGEDRGCWLAFLPDPAMTLRGFRTRRR